MYSWTVCGKGRRAPNKVGDDQFDLPTATELSRKIKDTAQCLDAPPVSGGQRQATF